MPQVEKTEQDGQGNGTLSRRDLWKPFAAAGAAVLAATAPEWAKVAEAHGLPFENGKYQTFPRSFIEVPKQTLEINGEEVEFGGIKLPVVQDIDLGTLGPDVDTIFGFDFDCDIPTGALVLHQPTGEVKETRVVGIKRTDLETVQFDKVLGGDRFDVYKISEYGGDESLDAIARKHAANTARQHQKVVYVGDLGLFQRQWGNQEKDLLNRIIRAQRPGRPDLGIQEPDFVNPRTY